MDFKKYNNLIELFFEQYKKQTKDKIFLSNLKDQKKDLTWEDVNSSILQLSNEISKIINKGDRCLLISENRPEWMISDLSIMLAGGITVPAYTTYVTRDYEYIINDCTPTIIFVSNDEQFKKIKFLCEKTSSIKKVFSFEILQKIRLKSSHNTFLKSSLRQSPAMSKTHVLNIAKIAKLKSIK